MSRYEVRLNHWCTYSGYTHEETYDWLQDAMTAEEYVKSHDGELEPYWGESGDTEVVIIEHLGGAADPEITYSQVWVSDVEKEVNP